MVCTDEHNAPNDLEQLEQLILKQLVIDHDKLDDIEHDNKHDNNAMRKLLRI